MGPELFTPTHLIFLAILGLLVFGPKRLPEIGRSLGTGLREFKSTIGGAGLSDVTRSLNEPAAPAAPAPPAPAVPQHVAAPAEQPAAETATPPGAASS